MLKKDDRITSHGKNHGFKGSASNILIPTLSKLIKVIKQLSVAHTNFYRFSFHTKLDLSCLNIQFEVK